MNTKGLRNHMQSNHRDKVNFMVEVKDPKQLKLSDVVTDVEVRICTYL